jgi:uncharacterized membrane protein
MNAASTILIGVISGIAATLLFEFILKTNKKLRNRYYRHHEILFGYHVHHSTYGLIFIAAGIIFLSNKDISDALFYISFGIGIIIQHTLSSQKFVFIEKWRKR